MHWRNIGSIAIIGFLASVGIAILWFWIRMMVEAASERDIASRVVWGLVVFFGGIFGAIVYSFVRLPRRIDEEQIAEDETQLREFREECSQKPCGDETSGERVGAFDEQQLSPSKAKAL